MSLTEVFDAIVKFVDDLLGVLTGYFGTEEWLTWIFWGWW